MSTELLQSREVLQQFVARVAEGPSITTYDELQDVIYGEGVHTALMNIIKEQGKPSSRVPGQVTVETRQNGWKTTGLVGPLLPDSDATHLEIERSGRPYRVGMRERETLLLADEPNRGLGTAAVKSTFGHVEFYYPISASPKIIALEENMGDEPMIFNGQVTSGAIMAATDRLKAPAVIEGFTNMAGKLVGHFLEATA